MIIPEDIKVYIQSKNISIDNLFIENFKPQDFYFDEKNILKNIQITDSNIILVINTGYCYNPLYNKELDKEHKQKYSECLKGIYFNSEEYFINALKWTPKIIKCLGETLAFKLM